MKHTKKNSALIKYYYSNNRYNILSFISLIPYFLYSPVVYCLTIPVYMLYLLRTGVFMYFILYIEKLRIWN